MNEWLGITDLGGAQLAAAKGLVDQLQTLPWWLVVATLALVPAVFEELFFRGFLFTSLRTVLTAWRAIVASALLFGVFHVVAGSLLVPERFLPSIFLGLALGWVRWRAGSVVPCMVLHALHNGLLLSVVYWREDLLARGIGIEEQAHMPVLWIVASVAGVLAAAAMLTVGLRQDVRQST